MKGITEIDERAALLLVRAYKAAYQSEGPRIRSEVWQSIAHQLNKQNTRNLTVTQWKKRISNIKSLVKLKSDMERRGRQVNWTSIEKEYLRLFPNFAIDDDNSSLSGGGPQSSANGFNLDDDQALEDVDEMDDAPATMVKTDAPKWITDQLRHSLLEAQKHLLVSATTSSNCTATIRAESNSSTADSTSTTTEPPASSDPLTTIRPSTSAASSNNEVSFQPQRLFIPPILPTPFLDLRALAASMDSTQRKQTMLICMRNVKQQIELMTELLEQDIAMSQAF